MSKQQKIDEIVELMRRKRPVFHTADGLPSLTFEETKQALKPEDYFQVLSDIAPEEQDKQIALWNEFSKRQSLYQRETQE